jgi:predicted metalloprotease with PDZ domain
VEVPAGAVSVEAALDFISPPVTGGEYTGGPSATDKLAIINWNTVLLYPEGWTSDELTYEVSLRLPAGWKFGTALPVAKRTGEQPNEHPQITFKPVSLTTLVDSPVNTGEYMRVVPLAENPHGEMDIVADSAAALDAPAEVLEHYRDLVTQAQQLFGTHHYREYHFLYTLSDHVAHFGLEHHESNDSREPERALVDADLRLTSAGLLPHEFVHSWNGKFRRPADLATPDYEKPRRTDLLWLYEGLTEYLGEILSARSGLANPDQFRDALAMNAAELDHRSGRVWRNLQDTADGVPTMQDAPHEWQSWRRPLDYYEEDELNWLWVDSIIRQETHGKKSMDDFCHIFHGGSSERPEVKTYTVDEVMETLNLVAAYDWRGFWTERLTNHGPGAPLEGIERSGWKLVYNDHESDRMRAWDNEHREINAEYSIGLWLKDDGEIVDTIESMPAATAGIGPGMRVVAINGRRFTADVLHDALRTGKNNSAPLELLIENTDYYETYKIDYHGGDKYPHLVRNESAPDVLNAIIQPR